MTRLLSLDGGGSWAMLQVRALMDLYGYDATGHTVLQDFDLVSANSGGSIVAAALAADWPLANLLNLFLSEAQRKSIFSPGPLAERLENCILGIGPKYSTGNKLIGLANLFGAFATTRMDLVAPAQPPAGGKRCDFIVTAFDYDRRRGVLFRSNPASAAAPLAGMPTPHMIEAVHASSTAPVNYFDVPAQCPSLQSQGLFFRFWDGGVSGLNNPVLIGVMELLGNGVAPGELQVLSIGTGSVRLPVLPAGVTAAEIYSAPGSPGTLHDIKELAGSILDDPPDQATYLAYLALGGILPPRGWAEPTVPANFIRISPLVQPICTTANQVVLSAAQADLRLPNLANAALLSAADNFAQLVDLDVDAIETSQVNLIQLLAKAWFTGEVYNQPVRSNWTLGCEIGHRFYPSAKTAWLALVGRAPPPGDPRADNLAGP